MNKKYEFDIKSFNKLNIWKFALAWLLTSFFLSILSFKETRSMLGSLWFSGFFGALILGMYVGHLKSWKNAYIEFNSEQLVFFGKETGDGDELIYSAWLTHIKSISQTEVRKSKIIINGNIEVTKFMDKNHKECKIKDVNRIEIPLYFEKNDELIESINSFMSE